MATPGFSESSPRTTSARSVPTMAARWVCAVRVVARDQARSRGVLSGCAARCSLSLAAWARRACSVLPDSTNGTATGSWATASTGSTAGACSMIVWALVPLMPNDEMPARRGRSFAGHSRASVSSSMLPSAQSTCGERWSACRVFGRTPLRRAMTILMMPATPAAACVCPMLDLSEPSHSGSSRSWP